jgi:hypothetical protein
LMEKAWWFVSWAVVINCIITAWPSVSEKFVQIY